MYAYMAFLRTSPQIVIPICSRKGWVISEIGVGCVDESLVINVRKYSESGPKLTSDTCVTEPVAGTQWLPSWLYPSNEVL